MFVPTPDVKHGSILPKKDQANNAFDGFKVLHYYAPTRTTVLAMLLRRLR